MSITYLIEHLNRVANLPQPFVIDETDAAVPVGTGQQKTLTFAVGFLYEIKGIEIITSGNQLFEGLYRSSIAAANLVIPAKSVTGANVKLTKAKNTTGRYFAVNVYRYANANGGPFNMAEDLEFPFGVTLRRVYANLETAPGAAQTVDFTVYGTNVLTIGNVTLGEAEALNLTVPANTDCDITVDDSAAAGDGYSLTLWFQINDDLIDYEENEYFMASFYRYANANGGPFNMSENIEGIENCVIRRAYAHMETAAGGPGNDVVFAANGVQLCTITDPAVIGEAENLNISVPADADLDISVNDAGALGDGYMLNLWLQRNRANNTFQDRDFEDIYGKSYALPNETWILQYNQGVTAETVRIRIYGVKYELKK